jgi:hypothetical protein
VKYCFKRFTTPGRWRMPVVARKCRAAAGLRAAGWKFAEIGRLFGVTRQRAWQMVRRGKNERKEQEYDAGC